MQGFLFRLHCFNCFNGGEEQEAQAPGPAAESDRSTDLSRTATDFAPGFATEGDNGGDRG